MENMESAYQSLFREVSPCVVLVEQVGRIDYFCIGSVIFSQGEKTFILTQSKILDPPSASLSVRFFDGFKEQATLLLRKGTLCVLMTQFYRKCKTVDFFEGDIDHIHVAAIAPATKSSVYNIPGFIIQKSLDVGGHAEATSSCSVFKNYFAFTCLYGDRSANNVSRLISAPIFDMKNKVVGIVIDDMQYPFWDESNDEIVMKKNYLELAYEFKIGMSSSQLQDFLRSSFEDTDWRTGILKAVKESIKRKRDEHEHHS